MCCVLCIYIYLFLVNSKDQIYFHRDIFLKFTINGCAGLKFTRYYTTLHDMTRTVYLQILFYMLEQHFINFAKRISIEFVSRS